jgi:hypothetical protein
MATLLDQEQIERTSPIAARSCAVERLPDRTGPDVSAELGGRLLVRYLVAAQVAEFTGGSTDRPHWVTPSPIAPEHAVSWLALVAPRVKREHTLLLDPQEIDVVRGPAWIRCGMGIEYYLPKGFPQAAIVDVGVIQVR